MEDLNEVTSKLSDIGSTLSSLHSDTQHLTYIDWSLSSISSHLSLISYALIMIASILTTFVINNLFNRSKDKNVDVSVDNYPDFSVVTIYETGKELIINISSVIKIESTDEGRAKITLSNGSEFELVETFNEIQKEIFE